MNLDPKWGMGLYSRVPQFSEVFQKIREWDITRRWDITRVGIYKLIPEGHHTLDMLFKTT